VVKELRSQAAGAASQAAEFSKQVHGLDVELASARTKLEVQGNITSELREHVKRYQAMIDRSAEKPAT
jgi:hypothetical protein